MDPAPARGPRAEGRLSLSAARRAGRSRIAGLHQQGALRALFPRTGGDGLEAVVTNTAGGVTGGDALSVVARAGPGSTLCLTTQAAERGYRAQPGETGRIRTDLAADAESCLHWLPQELILFDGCAIDRRLDVALAPSARFLMAEAVVFGRCAMGETLRRGRLRDRVAVHRDGAPVYLDGVDLSGDIAARLARPATGAGSAAMASVICIAPDAAGNLAPIRALLPRTAGASLVAEDILAVRIVAEDAMHLRATLLPVLDRLSRNRLPRCWRL